MQVVLIAAVSLDGRITRPGEKGAGFASAEDQQWFRAALREFDCSIMGRVTYDTIKDAIADPAKMEKRLRVVMTRRPAEQLASGKTPEGVSFTQAAPPAIIADLAARGKRR